MKESGGDDETVHLRQPHAVIRISLTQVEFLKVKYFVTFFILL